MNTYLNRAEKGYIVRMYTIMTCGEDLISYYQGKADKSFLRYLKLGITYMKKAMARRGEFMSEDAKKDWVEQCTRLEPFFVHLQDMSKRELEAAIKELNEVKAQKADAERREEMKTEQLDKVLRVEAKLRDKYNELEEQLKQAGDNKELTELKEKLANMEKNYTEMEANTGAAIEEKEKYQRLFNEAQGAATETQTKLENEIAKLKQENETLKNTPLEPTVVEKVPEETIKEMDALKAKIAELEKAKPVKSKEEKAFARHFENVREELQAAVECLGRLEDDKAEKCRGIFKKMLEATINAV